MPSESQGEDEPQAGLDLLKKRLGQRLFGGTIVCTYSPGGNDGGRPY